MKLVLAIFSMTLLGVCAARADSVAGTIGWVDRTELALGVSGTIAEVGVGAGDRAVAGAPLVSLVVDGFRAGFDSARQSVTLAAGELAASESELERQRILYDEGSLSTVELEHAELAHARRVAAHGRARAVLEEARDRLRAAQVEAPFDLVVIALHVSAGQHVVAQCQAVPAITVARAGVYAVDAVVDAAQAAHLEPGTPVRVVVDGSPMDGSVTVVGREPVAGRGDAGPRWPLTVRFDDPGMRWRIGMPATVEW